MMTESDLKLIEVAVPAEYRAQVQKCVAQILHNHAHDHDGEHAIALDNAVARAIEHKEVMRR
jgi:hypothetical protein